jgi:hypothetical protein
MQLVLDQFRIRTLGASCTPNIDVRSARKAGLSVSFIAAMKISDAGDSSRKIFYPSTFTAFGFNNTEIFAYRVKSGLSKMSLIAGIISSPKAELTAKNILYPQSDSAYTRVHPPSLSRFAIF